ncbi:MAG: hypothetical protein CM1200mP35_08090 [Chloroflexota bacterium]|nr:MAG: hypothetical protein CM1200mP35_08090 [Chloroflexota bacterium]
MSDIYLNIIILLVAVGIDLIIGKYPGHVHPTVWIGKTVSFAVKSYPNTRILAFL